MLILGVNVQIVDLPVVSLVEALRHAQYDTCTAVGKHDQIPVQWVDGQTFDLSGQYEIVHCPEQGDFSGFKIDGVDVIERAGVCVSVIAGDQHAPVLAEYALLERRSRGECEAADISSGLQVVAVELLSLHPVRHPDTVVLSVHSKTADLNLSGLFVPGYGILVLHCLGIVNSELERGNLLINLITDELGIKSSDILDFDLYLYDTTPACHVGAHNEFISAGRIDDLSMVHAGLSALLADTETIPETTKVLGIFDNEETGSQTKQGAGSPFLASIIQRIVLAQGETLDDYHRAIEKAFMISADNAHAWHPNYPEKYDPTNHPMLGGGPAGGSTLGNILASSLPLKGVDMGNPILGMHSVRETGAAIDQEYCIKAFEEFFKA